MDSTAQTTATSWLVRQPFLSVLSLSQLLVKRRKEVSTSEVLGELNATVRSASTRSLMVKSGWDRRGHPE